MSAYTQFDPNNPPPPLMTSEPNSFAYRTMTTRIPAIVKQVLADHHDKHPNTIKHALQSLHDELKTGQVIRPLETDAADGPSWAEAYLAVIFSGALWSQRDQWQQTIRFLPQTLIYWQSIQRTRNLCG